MKVANLILTYTSPQLTERLISKLQHSQMDFYIHVDKKFSVTPYLYLRKYPNVYFINNREDVRWAGYNTIKATFNCVREITASGIDYGYINFLSGQDYPIKSAEYILNFFERNNGKQFIEYKDVYKEWQEAIPRFTRYHFTNYKFKGKDRLAQLINWLTPARKIPYNLIPYGKAMFWMLTPSRAMYVVNFVEQNPLLERYLKHTWASDEFVFQTMLMNSPYKDELVNNDYRYIDWSGGGAHPKILTLDDLEKLKSTDDLFTRKVNLEKSTSLLNALDKILTLAFSITLLNGLFN